MTSPLFLRWQCGSATDLLYLFSSQFHSPTFHVMLPMCPLGNRRPYTVPALTWEAIILKYSSMWISVTVGWGLKKVKDVVQNTAGRWDCFGVGGIMVGFPEGLKEVQKIERGNRSTGRAFQAHACNAAPTRPRQEVWLTWAPEGGQCREEEAVGTMAPGENEQGLGSGHSGTGSGQSGILIVVGSH